MTDLEKASKLASKLKREEAKKIAQMPNLEAFRDYVVHKFLESGANHELVRTVLLSMLEGIGLEFKVKHMHWHISFTQIKAQVGGARTWRLEICPMPLKELETWYTAETTDGNKTRHRFSDVASGLETVSYDLFEGWIGHAQMMDRHMKRKA